MQICLHRWCTPYLSKAEDVVHKEQHILTLSITEVLSNGESSQSHSSTGTRRLIHLSEHQRTLAVRRVLANLVHTL